MKDRDLSGVRNLSRVDDHRVPGWCMENVPTGTLSASRALGIKLPKREHRPHTERLGTKMRGTFQPRAARGHGVGFSLMW